MFYLILGVFSFAFCFWYFLYDKVKLWNENRIKMKSIPGVPPEETIFNGWLVWLIGNVDCVLCPPDELFRRRQKFASFHTTGKLWLWFVPGIYTTSPENIEKIISSLKNLNKSFAFDPFNEWLRTGLFTSEGNKWQKRRKILTPSFSICILKSFMPIFIKETKSLVRELEPECNKDFTNIIPFMTKFALNSISETAMGTTLKHDETDRDYVEAVAKMTYFVMYRMSRPWLLPWFLFMFTITFWQQKAASKTLHNFTAKVIAERKKNFNPSNFEEDDLGTTKKKLAMLDMLLYTQKVRADIDDDGIQEEVDTFMFGGHDTSTTCLNYTTLLLACNRECQDKVYEELCTVLGNSDRDLTYQDLQELKYMERCIKESLRLFPVAPIMIREMDEDIITHEGHCIPKGTSVAMGIYDLHHDASIYPDPEKFDPDRFLPENIAKRHPYAWIPFSAGPRNCIGQKFAMIEIKTAITGILQNYILEPVDTPDCMVHVADVILRTKDDIIRVHFKRRKCN